MNIVVFRLGDEEYCIPVEFVQEIQGYRQQETPRSIPDSPDFFIGLINLRGHIIPVIDLKRHLGLGEVVPDRQTCFIITEIESELVGILVDAVKEVLPVKPDLFEAPPPKLTHVVKTTYIKGVGKLKPRDVQETTERLVVLLDIEKILSQNELEGLLQLKSV